MKNTQPILITAPNCYKCKLLKKRLNDKNIDYTELNFLDFKNDDPLLIEIKTKNLSQLPILKIVDEFTQGFDVKNIDDTLKKYNLCK